METIMLKAMILYNCIFTAPCPDVCRGSAYNFDTSTLLTAQCCCPATKEDLTVLRTHGIENVKEGK